MASHASVTAIPSDKMPAPFPIDMNQLVLIERNCRVRIRRKRATGGPLRAWAVGTFGALLMLSMACNRSRSTVPSRVSVGGTETTHTSPDGLVLTTANVEDGLVGEYRRDGGHIGFKARRRGPSDEALYGDPTAPREMISVVIMDRRGGVIAGNYSGFERPSPVEEVAQAHHTSPPAKEDLSLVAALPDALRQEGLDTRLKLEFDAIQAIIRTFVSHSRSGPFSEPRAKPAGSN